MSNSDWHKTLVESNLRAHFELQDKRRRAEMRLNKVFASLTKEIDKEILKDILEGYIDKWRREHESERYEARRKRGVA